jgi:NhaP-type Na+/H+ or K+/H+ antiporter
MTPATPRKNAEGIMALGMAELILIGLLVSYFFEKIHIPGLVGLLLVGILLGPHATGLLNQEIQLVSPDLRMIALVVILLRAGFELSLATLKRIGMRAVLMSFIPCLFEVIFITLTAPMILSVTYLEAAMLAGVLAAVSPAVIVPHMIDLIDQGYGTDSGVPTLILAGASIDDAFAIMLTSSFVGIYVGREVSLAVNIISVPVSVVTGIIAGIVIAAGLYILFKRINPRATKRTLAVIGIAVVLQSFSDDISKLIPFSALIAIMTIGFVILEKSEHMAHEISSKLGKIWIFAQILLFALIGTEVNITTAIAGGLSAAAVIGIGLLGRSLGVQLSLFRSTFTWKERLFVTFAYVPKATVQAAIGAFPLLAMRQAGMDTGPGELILSAAVLSILITAPLGSFLIRSTRGKLLVKSETPSLAPLYQASHESR